jgi:hypothetical protein
MWWILFAAFAGASPTKPADVLVVVSPGFSLQSHAPLIRAIMNEGYVTHAHTFPCTGQDSHAMASSIATTAAELTRPYVVVAHGAGATLSLMAADGLQAESYVLLAPILDVWPIAAFEWLQTKQLEPGINLSTPATWQGHDLHTLLLGEEAPALSCVSLGLAREAQQWLANGIPTQHLKDIESPVFIAVSLGDNLSTMEAVVPASRQLPNRTLMRMGVKRFDPVDFTHVQMLTHSVPIGVALDAIADQISPEKK